ncbi:MAG: hypothetical protein KGS46_14545 [Chloroflexi bacterium]|jgi:hypothetical protein|nr:hypothetical protein [Chloroflexota bacterium]
MNKHTFTALAMAFMTALTFVQTPTQAAIDPHPRFKKNSISQTPNAAVSPVAEALGLSLGIYLDPIAQNYGNEITQFNSLAGKKHGLIELFMDFGAGDPFDEPYLGYLLYFVDRQVPIEDRPVLMVSWMPMNGKKKFGCDKDYALKEGVPPRTISQGLCDKYIREYAKFFKKLPYRIIMKYGQEMSVQELPYWAPRFGQTPQDYIDSWRRIVTIFREEGVEGIEWFWGISTGSHPDTPENNHHRYYPGDEWVDWVGIIADNYYNLMWSPQPWREMSSFGEDLLWDFSCRYAKPQMIHEMASVDTNEPGKSKASWIKNAFADAPKYPFLRSMIYFNARDPQERNHYADFRITTTSADGSKMQPLPGFEAYKEAIKSPLYKTDLPRAKEITPPYTWCKKTTDTELTISSTSFRLGVGETGTINITTKMHSTPWPVEMSVPPQFSVQIDNPLISAPWGGNSNVKLKVLEDTPYGIYNLTLKLNGQEIPVSVLVGDVQNALPNQIFLPTMLNNSK